MEGAEGPKKGDSGGEKSPVTADRPNPQDSQVELVKAMTGGPQVQYAKLALLLGEEKVDEHQALDIVLNTLVGGTFDLESNFVIRETANIIGLLDLVDSLPEKLQANIWSMLRGILRKSRRNLLVCAEVGMIGYILSTISETSDLIADLLMDMLGALAATSISVSELRTLFSHLRAPGGVWPQHAIRLLQVLQQMPQRHGPDEFFSLPGRTGSGISLPPIDPKKWPYASGWTFSAWLRLDPFTTISMDQETPYVYCFRTSKGVGYSAHFTGSVFVVSVCKENGKVQQFCVKHQFEPRQWYMVTISHVYNRWKTSQIRCFVNGELATVADASWLVSTTEMFDKSFIGCSPDQQEQKAFCGQLSTVYLFNEALGAPTVEAMCQLGPGYKSQFKFPNECPAHVSEKNRKILYDGKLTTAICLMYSPVTCDSHICLESSPRGNVSVFVHSPHAMLTGGARAVVTSSVHSALHSLGGVQLLLPLFAQLDSTMEGSDQMDVTVCSTLMGLVCDLLESSVTIQQQMAQQRGFFVISWLLERASPKHFTMSLLGCFIRLVKFLVGIPACVTLLKQICDAIFFNAALWIHTDVDVQAGLYEYLSTEFLQEAPLFTNLVRRTSSTIYMLYSLKHYYWIEDPRALSKLTPKGIGPGRPDRDSLRRLRGHIIQFIHQMIVIGEGILDDELQALINYVTTVHEVDNLFDIVHLMVSLMANQPASMVPAFDRHEGLGAVYKLLECPDEGIRIQAIKLLGYFLGHSTIKRKAASMAPYKLFTLLSSRLLTHTTYLSMNIYNALLELMIERICRPVVIGVHPPIDSTFNIENSDILKVVSYMIRRSRPRCDEVVQVTRAFLTDLFNLCIESPGNRRVILQMSVWQEWLFALAPIYPSTEDEELITQQVMTLFRILIFHAVRVEYGGWRVWIDTLAIMHTRVSHEDFRLHMARMYHQYQRQASGDRGQGPSQPLRTVSGTSDEVANANRGPKQPSTVEIREIPPTEATEGADGQATSADERPSTTDPESSSQAEESSARESSAGEGSAGEETTEGGEVSSTSAVDGDTTDKGTGPSGGQDGTEEESTSHRGEVSTGEGESEEPSGREEEEAEEGTQEGEGHQSGEAAQEVPRPRVIFADAPQQPVFRIPEFRWSRLHRRLLSDMLRSIEAETASWKVEEDNTVEELKLAENLVFIHNTVNIMSHLSDVLITAVGGLLPLLSAATSPKGDIDVLEPGYGLDIESAMAYLLRVLNMLDLMVLASSVPLGELEQERNMSRGTMLRQCVRVVFTCAVRNCLESRRRTGSLMPPTTRLSVRNGGARTQDPIQSLIDGAKLYRQEAIHNELPVLDESIDPHDSEDVSSLSTASEGGGDSPIGGAGPLSQRPLSIQEESLLLASDVAHLRAVLYRDAHEETKQAHWLAMSIVYFSSVLMVSKYRDILAPGSGTSGDVTPASPRDLRLPTVEEGDTGDETTASLSEDTQSAQQQSAGPSPRQTGDSQQAEESRQVNVVQADVHTPAADPAAQGPGDTPVDTADTAQGDQVTGDQTADVDQSAANDQTTVDAVQGDQGTADDQSTVDGPHADDKKSLGSEPAMDDDKRTDAAPKGGSGEGDASDAEEGVTGEEGQVGSQRVNVQDTIEKDEEEAVPSDSTQYLGTDSNTTSDDPSNRSFGNKYRNASTEVLVDEDEQKDDISVVPSIGEIREEDEEDDQPLAMAHHDGGGDSPDNRVNEELEGRGDGEELEGRGDGEELEGRGDGEEPEGRGDGEESEGRGGGEEPEVRLRSGSEDGVDVLRKQRSPSEIETAASTGIASISVGSRTAEGGETSAQPEGSSVSDIPTPLRINTNVAPEIQGTLSERLEKALGDIAPMLKDVFLDFSSYFSKILTGSKGQELLSAGLTAIKESHSAIEMVMLLCSQEWQISLQKNAGLAFIELVNEGRILSHATRDHIVKVANEAQYILNKMRSEDVDKHAQFEAVCLEAQRKIANDEKTCELLIRSARQRDAGLSNKCLEKITHIVSSRHGPWAEETEERSYRKRNRTRGAVETERPSHFWKLDAWEDDSRRRRRFLPNPRGSTHPEAALKAALEHGANEDAITQAREDFHAHLAEQQQNKAVSDSLDGEEEDSAITEQDITQSADFKGVVVFSSPCRLVAPGAVVQGTLSVTKYEMAFESDDDHEENKNLDPKILAYVDHLHGKWPLHDVRAILSRRYLLQHTGLEIFLATRSSIFFAFADAATVKSAVAALPRKGCGIKYGMPVERRTSLLSPLQLFKASNMTTRWRQREVSNFDYIIYLNTLAGRSYNDLNQYPIFPWVLSNYESEEIDLSEPSNYRDLSKPIGALNPKRKTFFEERYNSWEHESIPPFHYGTHYSTSAFTLNWLVRLEPFTTMYLNLQEGKFDHADRSFSSVAVAWANAMKDTSDVKELIPEFYYLPEMFVNTNRYKLGEKSDGAKVDDVKLPPWADTPEDFVRIMRQALESEIVSGQLHEWIDLIFGYKQQGKEAVKATNVFYYLTYEGQTQLDKVKNPMLRQAVENQIRSFGQTPAQLLKEAHPPRGSVMSVSPKMFTPTANELSMMMKFWSNSPVLHITAYTYPSAPAPAVVTICQNHSFAVSRWNPNPSAPPPAAAASSSEQAAQDAIMASLPLKIDPIIGTPTGQLKRQLGDNFDERLALRNGSFMVTFDTKYILACGFWDQSFRVISSEYGKVVQVIFGHFDVVTCIARSEVNAVHNFYVLTGSKDCTCMIWHWNGQVERVVSDAVSTSLNPVPAATLTGHHSEIMCCAISAELGMTATASKAGSCLVHTLGGDLLRSLVLAEAGEGGQVMTPRAALISREGFISLVLGQGDVCRYSLTGKLLKHARFDDVIQCQLLSRDGQFLVTGGDKGILTVWRAHDLTPLHSYQKVDGAINDVALSFDQKFLLAALSTGCVMVYNVDFTRWHHDYQRE